MPEIRRSGVESTPHRTVTQYRSVDDSCTALLQRLRPLIRSRAPIVVVERLARGGGASRWFACRSLKEIEQILPEFRSGSRVGFFFDDRIRREPYSETLEQTIWAELADGGDVFLGREMPSNFELDVQHLDLTDCEDTLAHIPSGEIVYLGAFPLFDDDGVSCVVFTPPDSVGVVRPQPV